MGSQHHYQTSVQLHSLRFFNGYIRWFDQEASIVRHFIQSSLPIRGQPHEFKCVSITPFRAPHHEHGHIEEAGTNSQRSRQMSFDGVDTDKDVDVSGPIRVNP